VELALVILAVTDVRRAVGLYQQALEWELLVDEPVYAELRSPAGTRLGLYDRAGFSRNTGSEVSSVRPGATTASELYFLTVDAEAAVQRFLAAGARLLSALALRDWGDEAAYLADLDGNVVVVARTPTG